MTESSQSTVENTAGSSQALPVEEWFRAVKKEAEQDGYSTRTMNLKDWMIYYENGYDPKSAYEEDMCAGI